jgi:hypothetical protein
MPNNESVDIFGRRRRHPEKRIDCAAKLKHKRKRLDAVIKAAEKGKGKAVTSVTLPDGTTLRFGEASADDSAAANEWDEVYGKDKTPTRQ